jgi:hypothetical protein
MDTNPVAAQGGHSFSYKAAHWKVSRETTLENSWNNHWRSIDFVVGVAHFLLDQNDLVQPTSTEQKSASGGADSALRRKKGW